MALAQSIIGVIMCVFILNGYLYSDTLEGSCPFLYTSDDMTLKEFIFNYVHFGVRCIFNFTPGRNCFLTSVYLVMYCVVQYYTQRILQKLMLMGEPQVQRVRYIFSTMTLVTLAAFILAVNRITNNKADIDRIWQNRWEDWAALMLSAFGIFMYNVFPRRKMEVCKTNDL